MNGEEDLASSVPIATTGDSHPTGGPSARFRCSVCDTPLEAERQDDGSDIYFCPADATHPRSSQTEVIETINDFLLGSNGETCGFMFHPVEMDKEKALRTAAWLVAMNDPMMRRFPDILKAVCNT